MKNVLVLTKTNWEEAPRLRHQIARLLVEKGYQVTFVERNTYKSLFIRKRFENDITFYSHAELIHHQLRYFPIIQKLNNWVVKCYLKRISKFNSFDYIVNFNYDYSFLKSIFPSLKVVTIINDDFEEQAKFGMKYQIRNQVRATCSNSDFVLTVSYPLFNKIKTYTNNVEILFPWSTKKYHRPEVSTNKRNTVLYFGFIGRLDWDLVVRLVKETNYNYRFIGPTTRTKDAKMIEMLSDEKNFEYFGFCKWEDLKVNDVFSSILPYDPQIESVQACTISNRAFNLLSLGIPLVYADLKYIIESPQTVIRTNKNFEEYHNTLEYFHENFYGIQNDIEEFLNAHYKENRWKIFKRVLEK